MSKKLMTLGGVVANPAAPSVANQGTPATTAYSYKIVAFLEDGTHSAASSAGTTATGAATLNGTDFNRLTWTDPAVAAGAAILSIKVYRTASAGTPSSTGLIGTVNPGVETFDDTGLAGNSAVPASTNTSGTGQVMDVTELEDNMKLVMSGNGTATYKIMVSYDRTTFVQHGANVTSAAERDMADATLKIRVDCSSYTSGDPKVAVSGKKVNS